MNIIYAVILTIVIFYYTNSTNAQWKAQDAYVVELHHTKLESFNSSWFQNMWIKSFKINRKEFAFNISMDMQRNVEKTDKANIKVRAFKMVSQEYRLKLIELNLDGCDTVKKEFYKVAQPRYSDGSVLSDCPVKASHISAYNQKIDGSAFPPNIPGGSYRLQVQLITERVIVAFSFSLYIDVVYKKKNK